MPDFRPTKPILAELPGDHLDSKEIHTPCGTYRRVLDSPGGAPTAAIYYTHFHQSSPTADVFTRQFIVEKACILIDEWFRRHCYSIDTVHEVVEPGFNCVRRCPLFDKLGRHVRTEAEDAWERAAAIACNKYIAHINTLAFMELRGVEIIAWSSSPYCDGAFNVLSLALFDWPVIPGGSDCPTEGLRPHILPEQATCLLVSGSERMKGLASCVYHQPLAHSQPVPEVEQQHVTQVEHQSLPEVEQQHATQLGHQSLPVVEQAHVAPLAHQSLPPFEHRSRSLTARFASAYHAFRR